LEIRQYIINCKDNSYAHFNLNREYKLAQIIFNRNIEEDQENLDYIYEQGIKISQKVHPAAASDSLQRRELERLQIDGVSGFLAEWCWHYFLNDLHGSDFVKFTEFRDVAYQIDLVITKNNKRIEVRSSNVRNGVKFGLCNRRYQFHIVGPYKNLVKPGEVGKDFYVMVLYPVEKKKWFSDFYNLDIVTVDLTCGANWEMMDDENIYKWETLESKDISSSIKSEYRAIPFGKSLDTFKIAQLMNED